ncbi:MAG: helix-turn-helix domain-containing protein [Oscillospiraceae bacterium]|nr:helix-turn-helix domain-containing protein [Oscillospiraceae bacterium]
MEKQATFADRLKDALALNGLTKADLSRMTGISKSSLTHYEKGDWEGKQDAVYRIARALKVPESWLMGFGSSLSFEELQRSNAARILRSAIDNDPAMRSGKRLFLLMDNSNIPMSELTKYAEIGEHAILQWINDNKIPQDPRAIERVKNFYFLTTADLFPKSELPPEYSVPSNIIPMPAMKQIPLVGTIACGSPILAAENIEGTVDLPDHIHADFALRCKGDSMINARIYDGDIVYIRQQPTVESGEIAAVLIDNEATLKRVRLFSDHIALEPENPQYRPLVYWESEMNDVHILGLAVAFTSTVR